MSKRTFEHAIKRLDEIVSLLEDGTLSLEESLKLYEEGIELSKFCTTKLNEAEDKIRSLTKVGNDFRLKSTDI